mmetsp:Transcript_28506/g.53512  ORF Transcript_28506/g.53512 Transcript_28506/m.53512 type:complete len:211 (+) Transcript_28506:2276-2908(+)
MGRFNDAQARILHHGCQLCLRGIAIAPPNAVAALARAQLDGDMAQATGTQRGCHQGDGRRPVVPRHMKQRKIGPYAVKFGPPGQVRKGGLPRCDPRAHTGQRQHFRHRIPGLRHQTRRRHRARGYAGTTADIDNAGPFGKACNEPGQYRISQPFVLRNIGIGLSLCCINGQGLRIAHIITVTARQAITIAVNNRRRAIHQRGVRPQRPKA